MLDWLIPIIVDNILGYILDQSGIGERIHSNFEKDDISVALHHSLEKTFSLFETKYPYLATKKLFRQSFQAARSTAILGQLLLRDKVHDSNSLAELWADMIYPSQLSEHEK